MPEDDVGSSWTTGDRRAYVIGASDYRPPLEPLVSPRNDADAIADLLEGSHGYLAAGNRLTSGTVGKAEILALLEKMVADVAPEDRVVFYFAGHGVPPDVTASRAGYLVPENAERNASDTFLSMDEVYDRLALLPCRHLLIILDCCFAGSFRWARTRPVRDLGEVPEGRIYIERFRNLMGRKAWQLLTSAGAHELAADILFGQREIGQSHSPFAQALLDGLAGEADYRVRDGRVVRDGVITLGKLYDYLADRMRQVSDRQTVGYAPLDRHEDGEYLFLAPGIDPNSLILPSVRPELRSRNPYLGLKSYEFTGPDARPLYGRVDARRSLAAFVRDNPLSVVVGASGTGKSSLVRAGLMRDLAACQDWAVIPPVRPRAAPFDALAAALESDSFPVCEGGRGPADTATVVGRLAAWTTGAGVDRSLLLCVDQLEDLLTQGAAPEDRDRFGRLLGEVAKLPRVHLVLVVRSDYERQFDPNLGGRWLPTALADRWALARFPVPPLSDDELRAVIRGPANERAVGVDPRVVNALIREAGGRVGELSLLAAALEELYARCVDRVDPTNVSEWIISAADYAAIGGVAGGVVGRFERLLTALRERPEGDHTPTLQRVLLRMVHQDGLTVARRQVPRAELVPDLESDVGRAEAERIDRVLRALDEVRLIVFDTRPLGGGATEEVVEPIHDVVVRGWPRMTDDWLKGVQARADENQGLSIPQRRRLTEDAVRWRAETNRGQGGYTWADSPALPAAERELARDALAFNMMEAEFLRASVRQRRVARRRTGARLAIVAAVVLALLTAAGSIFTVARTRGLEAESRRLAALADTVGPARPDLAALLSVQSTGDHPTTEATASVLRAVLQEPRLVRYFPGQWGDVEHLAFRPDGRRLAAANSPDAATTPGRFVVWDVASGRIVAEHSHQFAQVMALALSPDLRHAAVSFAGGTIRLLDYTTGKYADWEPFSDSPGFDDFLAFDAGGRSLLASSGSRVWRLSLSERTHTVHALGGHAEKVPEIWFRDPVSALAFHPDGRTVDTGGYDGNVLRHHLISNEHIELARLGRPVEVLAFDAASGRLASGTDDGRITVHGPAPGTAVELRPPDGRKVRQIRLANGGEVLGAEVESSEGREQFAVWSVAAGAPPVPIDHPGILHDFGIAGDYVALGGLYSRLRLYRTDDGQQAGMPLSGHAQQVYQVAFSPTTPATLVTSGDEGVVIAWDVTRTSRLASSATRDTRLPAAVEGVAFSPADGAVAGGGNEGLLFARDFAGPGVAVWRSPDPNQMIRQLAFSGDGHLLAAGGEADEIILFDRRTDRQPRFIRSQSNVHALMIPPDATSLRTIGPGGVLRTFRSSDGAEISETKLIPEEDDDRLGLLLAATFRGDGSQIALGYEHGEVLVVAADDQRVRRFPEHSGMVSALAYSPDGTLLASSGENSIWLTDAETGRTVAILLDRHRSSVNALAFDATGELLAAGCVDGTILLFDLPTRQLLGTLPAHADTVYDLAFHPTAPRLLSGGRDRQILEWDLNFDASVAQAKRIADRNLSGDEWRRYVGPDTPYERTFPELPEGDGVTPEMKQRPRQVERWIVAAALLAWIPFTLAVPWSAIRRMTAHRLRFAAGLTVLVVLLTGALVPTALIPVTVPVWLDRGSRLLFLAAFGGLAVWAQRFLDLNPERLWSPIPGWGGSHATGSKIAT